MRIKNAFKIRNFITKRLELYGKYLLNISYELQIIICEKIKEQTAFFKINQSNKKIQKKRSNKHPWLILIAIK